MDILSILREAEEKTPITNDAGFRKVPVRLAEYVGDFVRTVGSMRDEQNAEVARMNGIDIKDLRIVRSFINGHFYYLREELRYCEMKSFFADDQPEQNPEFAMFSKAADFTPEYTEQPQPEVTDDQLEPEANARE